MQNAKATFASATVPDSVKKRLKRQQSPKLGNGVTLPKNVFLCSLNVVQTTCVRATRGTWRSHQAGNVYRCLKGWVVAASKTFSAIRKRPTQYVEIINATVTNTCTTTMAPATTMLVTNSFSKNLSIWHWWRLSKIKMIIGVAHIWQLFLHVYTAQAFQRFASHL
ncbi:unnamed protein product [Acanthoscelides obtectus]|uniref:Uncharacterized protein n=1 Tax=Acanthoscelides obtectus TaxID=200917 RepID=A0A9P0KCZ2_ACAOB|nr:unnamed protein product [Acanthoscelides obtectus]CAK1676468.1 hypothetical protein AOBTE_LOCUS30777 [Acanthoscelides obtectus]